MSTSSEIAESVSRVLQKIALASERASRPKDSVKLLAISKNQSLAKMEFVAAAMRDAGHAVIFGENYVQEFEVKHPSAAKFSDEFHFTGTLQSNKAGRAVELFDVIETIHSPKIAAAVSKECVRRNIRRRILLQVNISSDKGKSGFSPDALRSFLAAVPQGLEGIDIDGLMTITANYENPDGVRADYRNMRQLLSELTSAPQFSGIFRSGQLSMGMSNDYDIAIEEGATIVRVGTALFGERRV